MGAVSTGPDPFVVPPNPATDLRHRLGYYFSAGLLALLGVLLAVAAILAWRGPLPLLGALLVLAAAVAVLAANRARREGLRRVDLPWYLRELAWVAAALTLFVAGAFLGGRG